VGIDDPTEDFHSKMIEFDVVTCLVGLLQNPNFYKRNSSMKAIIALVNFGMLLYYFDYFEMLKG
jgi:hypothetical protein